MAAESKVRHNLIYLYLPQQCNKMQVQIKAISDEYLSMKLVAKKLAFPYLWYCTIKTSSFMKPTSPIRFSGDNDKIIIEPKLKFKRRERAYYHIEEDTTLFGMVNQNQKTQQNKEYILAHLRSFVNNWKTYKYSRKILKSLDHVIVVQTKDFLWNKTKANMMHNEEIKYFLQYILLFEA
eukprot:270233_1